MYLDYIVANRDAFGGTTNSVHAFDWDSKYAGVQVLLAKVRESHKFFSSATNPIVWYLV